jgi:membrane protease subunit HflC
MTTMSQQRMIAIGVAAFAVLIVLMNTFYVVDQRKQALVLRFGEPQRVVNAFQQNDPGLKIKAPFLENVVQFDKRNQPLEADQEEIIAADQERLVVDAFLRYRIADPLQYFRTLRDERTANDRLERLMNSSLRQVLGSASSNDIIAGRRAQLMTAIRQDVITRARQARLGIEVIDVRIKRAELPAANQQAVYRRMQTSRQQEAAQIRGIGEQQKREIMASADREVTITLATATEQSSKTRGEGDARRTAIYGASYGRDPAFAAFFRSMQAYDGALAQGDTTMILSPDSDFFRYYRNGPGR